MEWQGCQIEGKVERSTALSLSERCYLWNARPSKKPFLPCDYKSFFSFKKGGEICDRQGKDVEVSQKNLNENGKLPVNVTRAQRPILDGKLCP